MKPLILYLFVCAFFAIQSCKPKLSNIPINTMKNIILDMQVANEYIIDLKTKDTSVNVTKKTDSIFNIIMAKHNTTKNSFMASYSYYEKNPLLLNELLDSTANFGTKKRDSIINKLVPTSNIKK